MQGAERPAGLGRDFAFVSLGTFLQVFGFFLYLPILPLMVVGPLMGSDLDVGIVVGVTSAGALLVRPIGGFLLDRYGRRSWLIGASSVLVALTLAYAFATSLLQVGALRFLLGLVWGVAGVAAATLAADLVPAARRGFGMGIYGLMIPLGLSLGPLAGSFLFAGEHYDRVFWGAAIASASAIPFFLAARAPNLRDPKARLELRSLLESRVYRLFWFMLPLCAGYGGWLAFAPQYAIHVGLGTGGPLFTSYALGSLVPRVVGGRWYDRHGPLRPGLAGLLCLLVGWALLGSLRVPLGALAGAALVGVGFGTLMPVYAAMTMDLVPASRRGAANATTFLAFDIGTGLGSLVAGALVDEAHLPWIFLVAASLTLGSMTFFYLRVIPYFQRNRIPSSS